MLFLILHLISLSLSKLSNFCLHEEKTAAIAPMKRESKLEIFRRVYFAVLLFPSSLISSVPETLSYVLSSSGFLARQNERNVRFCVENKQTKQFEHFHY